MSRLDGAFAALLTTALIAAVAPATSGAAPGLAPGGAVLTGEVVDGQGGALPGATVELVALDTRARRSQTTDGDGGFRFERLAAGRYDLWVSLPGFADQRQGPLEVAEGQMLHMSAALVPQVSEYSEAVVAGGGAVEPRASEIATHIDMRELAALPLGGRNLTQAALVKPGVVPLTTGVATHGGVRRAGQAFARYVGTKGTRLPRFVEGNPAVWAPGATAANADHLHPGEAARLRLEPAPRGPGPDPHLRGERRGAEPVRPRGRARALALRRQAPRDCKLHVGAASRLWWGRALARARPGVAGERVPDRVVRHPVHRVRLGQRVAPGATPAPLGRLRLPARRGGGPERGTAHARAVAQPRHVPTARPVHRGRPVWRRRPQHRARPRLLQLRPRAGPQLRLGRRAGAAVPPGGVPRRTG